MAERLFPEYRWKDIAIGDLTKRNRVVLAEEVGTSKVVPSHRKECYATICRFTDPFKEHVARTGSVKRYEGPAYADFLWFDIDDTDLHEATLAALQFWVNLTGFWQVPPEDLKLYFSGSKGFHLGIPSSTFGAEPSELLPKILGSMARRIAAQVGVTIDLSLYQNVRLLRLPNTINAKSGLFKVALTMDDLGAGLEAVLERAGSLPTRKLPAGRALPNEALARLYQACREDASAAESGRKELPMLGGGRQSETPKHDKICVASLMLGVPNGRRNESALRIGVHLRQKGMPLPMATAAMLEWNRHNQTPLDEMEVQAVARSAYEGGYEFGCWDELLDSYCDKKCFLWTQKMKGREDLANDLFTTEELADRYMESIREMQLGKVSWGIPWIDERTRGIYPGQVCLVVARAGVGKTSIVINLLGANSQAGVPCLFASLEQLGSEVFERMAQNAAGITGEDIELGFARGDVEMIGSIRQYVGDRFKNVLVCDKSSLSITDLKAYVAAAEQKAGAKIRLLAIDYFGLMRAEGRDLYTKASELARGLKEVAKDCSLAVVVIVQLNRAAGRGAVEVEMDMVRDAGTIEEGADTMVGMWRINGDEEASGYGVTVTTPTGTVQVKDGAGYYPIYAKILKSRKGGANEKVPLIFRADVMRFEEITWQPEIDAGPVGGVFAV